MAPAGVVTEIDVTLLNEKPYVEMTLSYLDAQGISYEAAQDFSYFYIPGGSVWQPVSGPVPGDFSSAALPAAAAVISGGSVTLLGLDPGDTQGDKAFFSFLEKMGCKVQWKLVPSRRVPLLDSVPDELSALGVQSAELHVEEWQLTVSPNGPIIGGDFDLNATPDLFPTLAAVACFARGDTALLNVASARIKETDRIAAMAEELEKLGVRTTERSDGLIVHGTGGILYPRAGENYKTDGRGDHRLVMALACAALGCPAPVEIASAESAAVSYPGFMEMLASD
jgi:3-phosphoshikimate 1-carboxyvinyltransferase